MLILENSVWQLYTMGIAAAVAWSKPPREMDCLVLAAAFVTGVQRFASQDLRLKTGDRFGISVLTVESITLPRFIGACAK